MSKRAGNVPLSSHVPRMTGVWCVRCFDAGLVMTGYSCAACNRKEEKPRKNIHRITCELLSRRKTGKLPEKARGDITSSSRLKEGPKYVRFKVFLLVCSQRKCAFHAIFIKLRLLYSIVENDKYLSCFVCLDIIINNQFV